jgi:hypothetical protein
MGRPACPVLIAALVAVGSAVGLRGQIPPGLPSSAAQIRYNTGQNVVPYFEGWIKNADGTFDIVFGYFNRNWEEELVIAPGADNRVEPGAADRGQPTYFLPRRQRFVFRVRVPSDFGKGELVWTLTAHGRTEKAYGSLLPAQELTERVIQTNGGYNPGHDDPNRAPAIAIAPVATAAVASPVTLSVSFTDDGLPKPKTPAGPRPSNSATPGFGAQTNTVAAARPRGPTVTWTQYRGPAKVTFEPRGQLMVADGKADTVARFPEAGTYVLIASASDGALSTRSEVTIIVR